MTACVAPTLGRIGPPRSLGIARNGGPRRNGRPDFDFRHEHRVDVWRPVAADYCTCPTAGRKGRRLGASSKLDVLVRFSPPEVRPPRIVRDHLLRRASLPAYREFDVGQPELALEVDDFTGVSAFEQVAQKLEKIAADEEG